MPLEIITTTVCTSNQEIILRVAYLNVMLQRLAIHLEVSILDVLNFSLGAVS